MDPVRLTLRRELGKWDLTAIGINQTIAAPSSSCVAGRRRRSEMESGCVRAIGLASLLVALCFAK